MDFLGVPLQPYSSPSNLMESILTLSKERKQAVICYLNADIFNRAQKDPLFQELLQEADVVYIDGVSIALTVRLLYKQKAPRLTAADYFMDFLKLAEKEQLRLFFVGSTPAVIENLQTKLKKHCPRLTADFHHGYFTPETEPGLRKRIASFHPHLVIAGMGSPRQEKWSFRAVKEIGCPIWNVGALLDFVTGEKKRAPLLMQKTGLEWLYRLLQEPRRLAKRYLVGNIVFFINVLKRWKSGTTPHE